MEEKLLDTNDLSVMLSLHLKTVQKMLREENDFPKPIMITPHTRRWKRSEIIEWINSRHDSKVKS
jgi:predicted DNA-binding transcriptional regulator AlpA